MIQPNQPNDAESSQGEIDATGPHPDHSDSPCVEDSDHLLLLYWSGELSAGERQSVEALIQSSESARQYLEELAEIEAAFENISAEPSGPCLVTAALMSLDNDTGDKGSKTKAKPEKRPTPIGRADNVIFPQRKPTNQRTMRMLGWASTLALLLIVSISVISWNRSGWLGSKRDEIDSISASDVSDSQTTIDSSPFQAIAKLSQVNVSVTKSGEQKVLFRKRFSIQVGSKLFAKIHSTRNKLKSFRRRMEKRS